MVWFWCSQNHDSEGLFDNDNHLLYFLIQNDNLLSGKLSF